jgi:hypothetical protein
MKYIGVFSRNSWTIAMLSSITWATTADASLTLHIDPVNTTWRLSGSDTGTPGSTYGNMLWRVSMPGFWPNPGVSRHGSSETFTWSDPAYYVDSVGLAAFQDEIELQLSIGPNWTSFSRGTITANPSAISFYGGITTEGLKEIEASIGQSMRPQAPEFSTILIVRGENMFFPEPPGACLLLLGFAGLLLNGRRHAARR